jgi:Tol biopolymer transport system component
MAKNLSGGFFATAENLFLRDRQAGITYALTTYGSTASAMTPDGKFVCFTSSGQGPLSLNVWDSQAAINVFSNTPPFSVTTPAIAISQDGKHVAYGITGGLHIIDLALSTDRIIDNTSSVSYKNLGFNGDARLLACVRTASLHGTNQVYLYDTQAGNATLVSGSALSGEPGNDASDSPAISPDGRFVAYRSAASNIVSGDGNGVPDIFLYDVRNGINSLLSASRFGGAAPDNRSLTPVFSRDGRTLFFGSWASDLVPQDFNQNSDIFAFSFFYLDLSSAPGQGTRLSWPYSTGKSYRAQFKDNLSGADWHDLTGTWTNTGNKASLLDPTQSSQRFYRIVIY